MRPEVATTTLRAIKSAWPTTTFADGTPEMWAIGAPDVEPEVAGEALKRLMRSDNFAPSIARFTETVKLLERENTQPAIASGVSTSAASVASDRIALLKAFWKAAAADRPDHDHHNGHDRCPVCSTTKAWVDEHQPQALALMAEEAPL